MARGRAPFRRRNQMGYVKRHPQGGRWWQERGGVYCWVYSNNGKTRRKHKYEPEIGWFPLSVMDEGDQVRRGNRWVKK